MKGYGYDKNHQGLCQVWELHLSNPTVNILMLLVPYNLSLVRYTVDRPTAGNIFVTFCRCGVLQNSNLVSPTCSYVRYSHHYLTKWVPIIGTNN